MKPVLFPILVGVVSIPLVVACTMRGASRDTLDAGNDALRVADLAARHYCDSGHWPGDLAELRRTAPLLTDEGQLPEWSRFRDSRVETGASGSWSLRYESRVGNPVRIEVPVPRCPDRPVPE